MSVTVDIIRAYRAPRAVFLRRLGHEQREDRALALLMLSCVLIFVAQLPRLQREAIETGQDFGPMMGGALFAWLFIVPLVAYALAGLSRLVLMPLGGQGSWYAARVALFWALMVASPLWLLWGLVAALIGQGLQLDLVGIVALAAFVLHWAINIWNAERPMDHDA